MNGRAGFRHQFLLWGFTLCASAGGSPLTDGCPTALETASYLRRVAEKARHDGYPEIAIKYFHDILKSHPGDGEAHASLSSLYYEKEDFAQAFQHSRAALELEGETARNLKNAIRSALRSGLLDVARIYVVKARETFPEEPRFMNLEAKIELAKGRPQEALALLEEMVKNRVADKFTIRLRARIKGDLIVGAERNESSARMGRQTRLLMRQQRFHEALDLIDEQMKMNPRDVYALGMKAQVLLQISEPRSALRAVEDSLTIAPRNPAALGLKTKILLILGRPTEALAVTEQELIDDPTCPLAMGSKTAALIDLGKLSTALRLCDQQIQMYPRNGMGYYLKARVLNRRHDYREALEAVEQWLSVDPKDDRAREFKKDLLQKLNRVPGAIANL